MTLANGYNPLRWNCERSGCYNIKQRPKIEQFADCFPGKIALTDIDATVEINGRFLFMEFKSGMPRELPTGQRIYFERLTFLSRDIMAVIICGDAETMEVRALRVIAFGKMWPWEISNKTAFRDRLMKWAEKMAKLPPIHRTG